LKILDLIRKNPSLWFIVVYTFFLWALPNQNQTGDAYGYAFSMESGKSLSSPHHLLYNWLGYGFAQVFPGKAMWFMLKLNALLMGLSLFLLNKILRTSTDTKLALALTVFCAYSFASLRFSGLNETYVIPLFFSLLGSLLLLKKPESWKNLLLGFVSLTLAVLFHQIHVFWLLAWGLVYGIKSKKAALSFIFSGLAILTIYTSFASYRNQSLWYFITEDVQNGLVVTHFSIEHLFFTGVNSIRTIIQVHGDQFVLLREYPLAWLLPAVLLSSLIGFFVFRKNVRHLWSLDWSLSRAAMLAFLLHFALVVYSMGNAEFMLMLPFLGVIAFGKYIKFSAKSWMVLAVGIGIWNMGFDTLPKNLFDYHKNQETREWLKETDAKYFAAHNRTTFTNFMDWKNACEKDTSTIMIFDYSKDYKKILQLKYAKVLTNLLNYPSSFDRKAIHDISITKGFKPVIKVNDSIPTWRGQIYLGILENLEFR